MRTNAIIRIIIFSIVICILLALLILGIHWDNGGFRVYHPSQETQPRLVDIDGGDTQSANLPQASGTPESSGSAKSSSLDKLSIDWVSGTITIRPGDTDTILYQETEVTDNEYQMVVQEKGSALKIQYCKDGVKLGWPMSLHKDLTITVPQDWLCRELEIEAASATVEIDGLTIQEFDLDTASGTCRMVNCNVEEMDVDTASGDVDFSGNFNSFECDSASAKITLVLDNVPKKIEVDTASGDVDLTLPADAGFTATVDGLSTRFTSEFSTTTQNSRYICGDGRCSIKVDALSAGVTIRKGIDSLPGDV